MRRPLFIGKISYIFGYPFIRLWLWRSKRVYLLIWVDDELLVTKNWLGLHRRWRLPGGGLHDNEDDRTALIREIKEELGLSIETMTVSQLTRTPVHSRKGYTYSLFNVYLPHRPVLNINDGEIVASKWTHRDCLSQVPICSELKHALGLLARQ